MKIADLHRRLVASKPLLLLDKYPNAATAFSLRLLNSNYKGNCIQVRRFSDNALQDIGFVNGVLDTASLLSFTGSSFASIRTWYDQSGNGRNAVQTSTGFQPTIVQAGSLITEGGKPTLLFSIDTLLIDDFQTENYTSISILAVHKPTNTAGVRAIFSKNSTVGNNRSFFYAVRDDNLSSNASSNGSSPVLRVISSSISVNDYQLSSLVFRGDQNGSNINKVDYFKNGNITNKILDSDNTVTSLFNPDIPFAIGAERAGEFGFFAGNISEVIFYEFNQFDNIPAMHNLSNQYYNIF